MHGPKGKREDARQLKIDYPRATQLTMIRECEPPLVKVAGVGVAPKSLKAVLWCLDEHGRGRECWPSIERIADMTKLAPRTVKRAIQALQQLSVICVERRKNPFGVTQNHYRVVWSELKLLCQPGRSSFNESDLATRQPATMPAAATRPPESDAGHTAAVVFASDQSAVASDQSAVASDQSAVAAPKPPMNRSRSASSSFLHRHGESFWPAAAAELSPLIGSWRAVIDCAQARGLDEAGFLEQVALGQATIALPANARRFTKPLGALAFFLREGNWPVEGVVTPDEQRELEAQQRAVRQREARERERLQQTARALAEQQAALERDHGPHVDALPAAELAELAGRVLNPFLLERFQRRGIADGIVREALLKHFVLCPVPFPQGENDDR